MKFWTEWSLRRRVITVAAGILAAAALAYIGIQWQAFVEEDNAQTCYDARYWTGVRYIMAVRDALEDGAEEDSLDYEQILRDVVAENFTYELTEDLTSPDLCRGGGFCRFTIDEETHGLSISCDREDHLWYDDTDLADEDFDWVTW